ncbi:acyl-CoA dehydrogenase family protein [Streptomyces sp. NBC_01205]|uniref:acyl-CoA dehydrogenase family protein n=1 Tax=Streptomyces sp. NBC_01205 TaxID=2903771 RepID=UPI002E1652D6|nr:acyl-CoA/acyl-ACP dehydrogenase [Streptomyces sp. NBC_01205]
MSDRMQWAPGAGTALATPPDLAADPLVSSVTELAVGTLVPAAEETAQEGVPRSHLDALARCGAYGALGHTPDPGSGLTTRQVVREVNELLSAADPSTWFVHTQHFGLVKGLQGATGPEAAALRERWSADLASGTRRGTAGFAFLRHARPPVTAEPTADGWRLRGRVPWMTGWGLSDVVYLGALAPDDRVLFAAVDCGPDGDPGLVPAGAAELWAMNGTRTVAVEVRDVLVPPSAVVCVQPRAEWARAYDLENANAHPAVFGHVRAAADFLLRSAPAAGAAYEELGLRVAQDAARLRTEAYALRDELPPQERVEDRLALRAAVLELGVRAATACVAATGGRAISYGNTAGRLAREAQFHLVQAQTSGLRSEMARLLLGGPDAR